MKWISPSYVTQDILNKYFSKTSYTKVQGQKEALQRMVYELIDFDTVTTHEIIGLKDAQERNTMIVTNHVTGIAFDTDN